jgi:hypothetical protein
LLPRGWPRPPFSTTVAWPRLITPSSAMAIIEIGSKEGKTNPRLVEKKTMQRRCLTVKGLRSKVKGSSPFIIERDGLWARKSRITNQY